MKNTLTILLQVFLTNISFAQNDPSTENVKKLETFAAPPSDGPKVKPKDQVLLIVDVDAEFPGGQPAMKKFITDNVKYPARAIKNNIEGKTLVRFTIDKKGRISDIKILRGMKDCPECNAEAMRVVSIMPKWKPAINNGKKVKSYFEMPFVFRLN